MKNVLQRPTQQPMEFNIENFQQEYNKFRECENYIHEKMDGENAGIDVIDFQRVLNELENLDVKARLAFGISEIQLNNEFVSDKEGDLKLCHLLYYKLADLWFAYETYIKFFEAVMLTSKHNITWLDTATHQVYASSPEIITALELVNHECTQTYNSSSKRDELIEYLNYCKQRARESQRRRLAEIIAKIEEGPFSLTHTETLTIIYSIRNNFVHNGETTVVPSVFGYSNKSKLLKILYPYLCLVLLSATNITCRRL